MTCPRCHGKTKKIAGLVTAWLMKCKDCKYEFMKLKWRKQ